MATQTNSVKQSSKLERHFVLTSAASQKPDVMQHMNAKPKPLPFTKRSSKVIVDEFLVVTATHGLRNVGIAHSTPYRFLWISFFSISFGFMLYFVISSVLQYMAYPTQTNVDIELERDMIFPAVTICNANPYRTDKITPLLMSYAQLWGVNATASNLADLCFPMIIDLFNRNETTTWNNIGFQLEDMLLGCSFNGIDCSNNFIRSTSSVFGNCFTFNWNTSTTKLFSVNDAGSSMILFNGLILTFYLPKELNYPLTTFDDGLIVLLHDNNELPQTVQNGLRLRAGMAHQINFRKIQTIFLPKPYTNCTTSIKDDLRTLYRTTFESNNVDQVTYSEPVCHELCTQAFIFSQCSCIVPIPFFTRYVFNRERNQLLIANACQPYTEQQTCSSVAAKNFSTNSELWSEWCSHCVSQCSYTSFSTDMSATSAPSVSQKQQWANILLNNQSNTSRTVALPNDFATNYDTYLSSNYLRVTISCSSRYVTINRQEAKVTIVDTFAAIGGQTGLWIGLSVLSLIEFGELIFWLVVKAILALKCH